MPNPVARVTAAGRWLPMARCMAPRLTKACTTPDSPKPRISGHRVCQNMYSPSRRLRPMSSRTVTAGASGPDQPGDGGRRLGDADGRLVSALADGVADAVGQVVLQ